MMWLILFPLYRQVTLTATSLEFVLVVLTAQFTE